LLLKIGPICNEAAKPIVTVPEFKAQLVDEGNAERANQEEAIDALWMVAVTMNAIHLAVEPAPGDQGSVTGDLDCP
jgi:hypothetical protein